MQRHLAFLVLNNLVGVVLYNGAVGMHFGSVHEEWRLLMPNHRCFTH